MKRIRTVSGAALGAAVLLGSSLAGVQPAAPRERGAEQQETAGGEFVVAYEGSADQAAAAVAAAGGTVVDVNESANLVLASASDGAFLNEVRTQAGVSGAARNHAVGTTLPGTPHRYVEERPSEAERAEATARAPQAKQPKKSKHAEPLADLQWNMAMIGATDAHKRATGRNVTIGIIDTGVDASHPDLAPNFNAALSRNFTMDIPEIDGPCEVATCIDPANVDEGGHGTHVAGIAAAARNDIGIAGVAPRASIVNIRAGQDSGFFFLYETVAALTYAGDAAIDVVNMSFFTDPWLYNCDSADDYVSGGPPTAEELEEQAFTKETVTAALEYAHAHGVTLVGSAGNEHTDLAAPTRLDTISPDYPLGTEQVRTVTKDCLDLPSEGPHVISVGAVGPSTTKADYSNYGLGEVDVTAPGGWFRDFFGTPQHRTPGTQVFSSYPLQLAIDEGLADQDGNPTDDFSVKSCDTKGNCGFYTGLQGTSMAAPHVTGLAALIIEEKGHRSKTGYSLDPDTVANIIRDTATDHVCPVGYVEDYTQEGRPAEFNAACAGTTDDNSLYGEGIINAWAAVN
jgi:subtilisin family serine protease